MDEQQRLEELASYAILDTPPEDTYDDLVKLASRLLGAPIALVTLVDRDRQWFKARRGVDVDQTPREISFCAHVVDDRKLMVVTDASRDPRFADNPLVVGEPKLRFYLGAPLRTPAGHVLGTLCVADRVPRIPTPEQLDLIELLARRASTQLELRRKIAAAEQAREHAERSDRELHRFFELSRDLLCIADFRGYYRELNPAWTNTFGFSREELLSRPFIEFFHPDDREATAKEAARVASAHGETLSFENRHITKDGQYRWLVWSAAADPEQQLLMAVARDVTSRRKEREALELAKAQAEAANEAKSEFLAKMNHELRTPLNSVIGFTNVLLRNKREALSEQDLDYLHRIKRNGHHLMEVIGDVLDLTKIESGNMPVVTELVALPRLLRGVVEQLHGQVADGSVTLVATLPEHAEPILTDAHLLRQVCINLIGNAVKFSPGGTVEVRLVVDESSAPLRIEVVDDGIGIATEDLPVIFENFRQAEEGRERRFGGTGLGLPISRALCEQLGFHLEVVSEQGVGTTFAVTFTPSAPPLTYRAPAR